MFNKIFNGVSITFWVRRTVLLTLAIQFVLVPVRSSSFQQPPTSSTQSSAQNTTDALTLEFANSVKRELTCCQKHSYAIPLLSGYYFKVTFKQQGINIGASLELPDGTSVLLFDPIIRKGDSSIERVVDASGTYKLTIFTTTQAALGGYEIRSEEHTSELQ